MKKITLSLLLLFSLCIFGQDRAVLNLENNDDYSSFSLFDSLPLDKYNLFFTGEDHRYMLSNSDLELKMFKYLHKKVGVRVFMVEFGQSMGYLMNKFVYDGDSVAKEILKNHSHKAYFKLFENLREFNASLPEEDKFTVRSVDLEREPLFAVKLIETFLPAKDVKVHDSIKIHLDAIRAVSEYYDAKRDDWGRPMRFDEDIRWGNGREYISPMRSVDLMMENFDRNKDKYKQAFKENFTEFEQAIERIREYDYWRSLGNTAQQYLYRETYMENNVKALFNENPDIKIFGQFGRCHTQLQREEEECNYYYFNALATRLNTGDHKLLKGKVFSCPVFYPNSYSFNKDAGVNPGVKTLAKEAEKNKITAYTLDTIKMANLKPLAKRFNVIIINNLQKDKSQNGVTYDDPFASSTNDYYWNERLIILGEAGVNGYNTTNLNTALGTNYNNLRQFVGFSINYAENYGFNMGTAFHWFPSEQKNINDSTTASLSGFSVKMRYGKDIIKKDHYDFKIGVGYGFERWTNTIEEEFDDELRRDIFGSNRTTQYTNPAFVMDAGFDFRIHASWVTFGFFGRYQLDFSNRKWRLNNVLQPNTPKFSLNAYSIGFSLGFNTDGY
jgi:hypothetical protein